VPIFLRARQKYSFLAQSAETRLIVHTDKQKKTQYKQLFDNRSVFVVASRQGIYFDKR